jgi:hypothetical protein
VLGVRAGHGYVDVGTLDGYRQALRLLGAAQRADPYADAWAAGARAPGAPR